MPFGSGEGDPYTRQRIPFLFKGITDAKPVNLLELGEYNYVKNVRSYQEGRLQTRPGSISLSGGLTSPHSIFRLNDIPANDYTYIVGDATVLRFGKSGALASIDTAYSGSPLTAIQARPERSPSPLLYVADSNKMRKVNVTGQVFQWGIFPPLTAPSVTLSPAQATSITDCGSTNPEVVAENGNTWARQQNVTIALTQVNRTNTTISAIIYDSGTTGYCNIVPVAMGT